MNNRQFDAAHDRYMDPPDEEFDDTTDDFPGWPIAIGLMASAGLGCWGLWHLALWAGRL